MLTTAQENKRSIGSVVGTTCAVELNRPQCVTMIESINEKCTFINFCSDDNLVTVRLRNSTQR